MPLLQIVITAEKKPPLGGMGGSIHNWARGTDPFHKSKFPAEFQSQAPNQADKPTPGWEAVDACGNLIDFLADGYIYKFRVPDGDPLIEEYGV